MLFLSILCGSLGLLNFWGWTSGVFTGALQIISILVQAILFGLSVFAAIRYQGKRRKRVYIMDYKVFTIPFAITLVSAFGNLCLLVVLVLNATGVIGRL